MRAVHPPVVDQYGLCAHVTFGLEKRAEPGVMVVADRHRQEAVPIEGEVLQEGELGALGVNSIRLRDLLVVQARQTGSFLTRLSAQEACLSLLRCYSPWPESFRGEGF